MPLRCRGGIIQNFGSVIINAGPPFSEGLQQYCAIRLGAASVSNPDFSRRLSVFTAVLSVAQRCHPDSLLERLSENSIGLKPQHLGYGWNWLRAAEKQV